MNDETTPAPNLSMTKLSLESIYVQIIAMATLVLWGIALLGVVAGFSLGHNGAIGFFLVFLVGMLAMPLIPCCIVIRRRRLHNGTNKHWLDMLLVALSVLAGCGVFLFLLSAVG